MGANGIELQFLHAQCGFGVACLDVEKQYGTIGRTGTERFLHALSGCDACHLHGLRLEERHQSLETIIGVAVCGALESHCERTVGAGGAHGEHVTRHHLPYQILGLSLLAIIYLQVLTVDAAPKERHLSEIDHHLLAFNRGNEGDTSVEAFGHLAVQTTVVEERERSLAHHLSPVLTGNIDNGRHCHCLWLAGLKGGNSLGLCLGGHTGHFYLRLCTDVGIGLQVAGNHKPVVSTLYSLTQDEGIDSV